MVFLAVILVLLLSMILLHMWMNPGTFVLHHLPIFGLFKSDVPQLSLLSFLGNKRNASY